MTKGSDSSFAEVRRGFNSEPIHIEDEVEDQEDMKWKMRETVKSAKWRVAESQTLSMKHGWDDAHKHLEPMSSVQRNTRKCDV